MSGWAVTTPILLCPGRAPDIGDSLRLRAWQEYREIGADALHVQSEQASSRIVRRLPS